MTELKRKNREQKESDILDAVGRIFIRDGFNSIGINTIAAEAKCNKVLIYRYFGGIDGVLEQFAKHLKLLEKPDNEDQSVEVQAQEVFGKQIKKLRSNPLLREIMKWELIDTNPLTEALAKERESTGMNILESLKDAADEDIAACAAILSAAVNYLAIRADSAPVYCGIPIDSDEGWERIENAINSLIKKLQSLEER